MIPMTPSASVAYRELESEESAYWPSVSPGVPLSTSGDEGAGGAKVRKPYTITKQRERWTEDEHLKFLEALKLYGRAWRRIEEHIGTKTAVQIRSHAQKFFSKIERDGGGAETGVAQVIDIPPPRPKRKPTHPYPRKAGRSFGKISEDDCPLATAGSISSSSAISTVNIAEGCSKSNNVWEQDDTGEACHQDAASKDAPKANHTDSADAATRPWGTSKPANAACSSPATAAPIALSPPSSNQSPLPVAFPTPMPWARIFGGAMNPAMVNPAMINPAMINPAMINPAMMSPQGMGMMMPWAAAASGAPENGGTVSAIAATIAAASAWWAMQGGIPPTVIHPTMGAMYMGGAPPFAIPNPYLFSHCAPQEVTVAATVTGGDVKEGGSGSTTYVGDDGQDIIPSSNGNTSNKSSALRRATRAQRVKELKARRMGSGNHLLSVSSDVCPSMSGGSGTNNSLGQVTTAGNLSSGNAVRSLSKGVSLPANLSNVKQTFHDLVRTDREPAADVDDGGGDDKRKRLRRASNDTIMVDSENSPSITTTTDQSLNPPLEKVGSISGSNNLSEQFTKILKDADRSQYGDEATPTDASQSCGSDGSEGAKGDAQAGRGPSSNSSACGNNAPAAGTDRSASSDGSSEGEATVNIDRQRDSMENNDRSGGRSSADPDVLENADESSRQYTFNEFLPVRRDGEKPDGGGAGGGSSRLLPRAPSIDGEQRKEVTERGQIAFQALFKRDTLPRTFSPPPGLLTLPTEPKQTSRPSSACNNISRSRSANAMDSLELRSPRGRSRNQDSAFNAWQQLRGTCNSSKLDRCESGVSIPSSEPTKILEELQSSEHRRNTRKGRTYSDANNWLQLAPTSSRGRDDEDVSADSGADDQACQNQQQQQQKESFVCELDLSIANDRNDGSDTDGPVVTSLDLSPSPTSQSLSLSIGSCLKQQQQPHNNSSSVSNRTVKCSGLGFVPYQRATPSRVETTPEEKN